MTCIIFKPFTFSNSLFTDVTQTGGVCRKSFVTIFVLLDRTSEQYIDD